MKINYGVNSVVDFTYIMESEGEPDITIKGQGKIVSIEQNEIHIEPMNITIDGKHRDDVQSNQIINHEDITDVVKF
nr:hypothetical protein Q7S_14150 [Rahnella aquatilis HX2]